MAAADQVWPTCALPLLLQALARLKHPGVLRLVAPLEETRTQLVFITEPIFASLADLLGGPASSLPPAAAAERRELRLSGEGGLQVDGRAGWGKRLIANAAGKRSSMPAASAASFDPCSCPCRAVLCYAVQSWR